MPQPECPHCGGEHFMRSEARISIVNCYVDAIDASGEPVELGEPDPAELASEPRKIDPDADVAMEALVGGPLIWCMGCGRRYDTVPIAEG